CLRRKVTFMCVMNIIVLLEEYAGFIVCFFQCPQSFAPVCASDGNTYHSECFLRQTACEQQTAITVITEGHCHAG
uniref:Kazal-like domain-containing protein n=1 Tax=Sinocyclocheilus anshuiensis TaxID=1608454 RepID=A0A671K5K9_9TELE